LQKQKIVNLRVPFTDWIQPLLYIIGSLLNAKKCNANCGVSIATQSNQFVAIVKTAQSELKAMIEETKTTEYEKRIGGVGHRKKM